MNIDCHIRWLGNRPIRYLVTICQISLLKNQEKKHGIRHVLELIFEFYQLQIHMTRQLMQVGSFKTIPMVETIFWYRHCKIVLILVYIIKKMLLSLIWIEQLSILNFESLDLMNEIFHLVEPKFYLTFVSIYLL